MTISGSAVWGHVTGVTQSNVRTFTGNWTGTGTIENSGDAERIALHSAQYMEGEVVNTGIKTVSLSQNVYDAGDMAIIKYRHGVDSASCLAASWNNYTVPFGSLGYVQIRIESIVTGNTYFVSTSGSDAHTGLSEAQAFRNIQTALNTVAAGDAIVVASGTYTEALTIVKTGTSTKPIYIHASTNLGVTVNAGSSKSIRTSGAKSDYVIDGFRFISTSSDGQDTPYNATISLSYNYWGDGDAFEVGNDRFTIRNCYIEGSVYIYGSDCLVENCEFNGTSIQYNAITERSQPSENNIFRNNIIHDYLQRGGWTLSYVHNSLWQGNTLYNIGSSSVGGSGIDCDGAGHANYGCNIINNIFYNIQGECAILMENGFDSTITGNIIHDSTTGIGFINYNIDNGADPFVSDSDHKNLMTNTIITYNLIYNMSENGINVKAVRGNTFSHNTIYNADVTTGYWGGIGLAAYDYFYCPDWIITNNIVAQTPKTIWYQGSPAETIDYNFYDTFTVSVYGVGDKTFSQWQAMGFDVHGGVSNPLFVNAAGGDFHLQSGSPASGSGVYPTPV